MSVVWRLMSDVRCLISDVWCRMFDVWCQMYDVWCEMSDFWCLMSNVCEFWFLMSNVWCSMSRFRSLMYDVCCLISDVRSVRCLMSDVSEGSSYRKSTAYGPSDYRTIVWNQRSFGTGDHNVWSSGIAKVEQKFLLAAIRYRDNLPHRLRVVQFQQSPRWLFWILIPFTFHLPWWSCKNTKIRLRLLGNAQEDMFEWTCQLGLFEKQIFTKKTKVTIFLTTKRTLEWCSTLTHLQFRHHLRTCYRPCLNVLRNGLKL